MERLNSLTGGQVGTGYLLFVFLMIALTNFFDTTAYAARLAGVRTQKISLANSLFAMLTFGSRTTTALYLPAIAAIAQRAINQGFDPLHQLQFVLLGAAVGTAIAIVFLPAIQKFYELGIDRMEQQGSALSTFKSLFLHKQGWIDLAKCWRWPRRQMWKGISLTGVPKDMIVLNAVLYAFFTVGSVATYYAGSLNPAAALTATGLSPAINAVAAFLLLFLVDPRGAIIMDQGIQRKIPFEIVKSSMVYLALSRLVGTALSILVLYPAALFVSFLAKFI
ncbi:lipid II flippase family protein [Effusibacillus pohliae]|uniref:lipid II flippase family protein n=1 Tax=Effusibacillus pohliae TaxID=232270 RepID=UPI00035CDF99|nr:DUF2837 family protein [Effusibacillus pohliae]